MKRARRTGSVVWLEAPWAELTEIEERTPNPIKSTRRLDVPRAQDETGRTLMTCLATKLQEHWSKEKNKPDALAVVLPGTIVDGHILSAGRLGIRQRFDGAALLAQRLSIPTAIFHDMDCLVAADDKRTAEETVTYVYVDEGVGGLTLVNGVELRGAGHAGVLGRLVMNPMGPFSPSLAGRGVLEIYTARPWLSEHMVAQFIQQKDKRRLSVNQAVSADENSAFRRALKTLAAPDGDRTCLEFAQMAWGLRDKDPIAETVLDVAAQHLGLALSSIITLLNPHRIVLAGGLFADLPEIGERALHLVGQYTSTKPLNATRTEMWDNAHLQIITGACRLNGFVSCP